MAKHRHSLSCLEEVGSHGVLTCKFGKDVGPETFRGYVHHKTQIAISERRARATAKAKAEPKIARALAKARADNPPWLKPGEKILGEVTVGGSQHRRAVPRIVGSEADIRAHCLKMGICTRCRIRQAVSPSECCSECQRNWAM
jgi:hypothetical protein